MNKALSDLSSHTPMMQQYFGKWLAGLEIHGYALAIV
jgi:hypothetical protein